ncbi:MAG: Fe-S cluster assembly protein IscX [Gammaproteobacteria bacterium AqS3]|nr:Fe-S cluster assembly protein IscX [Gammaproteobacteria bacterium AqS3]
MRWTDVNDIAIALYDADPSFDPLTISFPDLRRRVLALPEFKDEPDGCGERILEAIQMAWLEEYR